jgi:hypothetical protein
MTTSTVMDLQKCHLVQSMIHEVSLLLSKIARHLVKSPPSTRRFILWCLCCRQPVNSLSCSKKPPVLFSGTLKTLCVWPKVAVLPLSYTTSAGYAVLLCLCCPCKLQCPAFAPRTLAQFKC